MSQQDQDLANLQQQLAHVFPLELDSTLRLNLSAALTELRRRRQDAAQLGQDLGELLGSPADIRRTLTSAAEILSTTAERTYSGRRRG